jgi:hypothetical protein
MPDVSVSDRRQPLDHVSKAIIAALQQDGQLLEILNTQIRSQPGVYLAEALV